MSRVSKRAGTKALTCMACQRKVKGGTGRSTRTVMSFRGQSQARLDRHIKEVHGSVQVH